MDEWEALPESRLFMDAGQEADDDLDADIRCQLDRIEAARNTKLAELEAEFRRHYDAAVAAILQRWEIADETRKCKIVGQEPIP